MSDYRQVYDSSLQVWLQPLVAELKKEIERTLLRLVTPNAYTSFNVSRFKRWSDMRDLSIISWYLGDFGILLREELLDSSRHFKLKEQEILRILCSSKQDMLDYLAVRYHHREFYGNLKDSIKMNSVRLHFIGIVPKTAKRKVRRRGYQDKGSCRPLSSWLPTRDWTLNQEHFEIESERQVRQNIFNTIAKYGVLGVRLPETEGKPMDGNQ